MPVNELGNWPIAVSDDFARYWSDVWACPAHAFNRITVICVWSRSTALVQSTSIAKTLVVERCKLRVLMMKMMNWRVCVNWDKCEWDSFERRWQHPFCRSRWLSGRTPDCGARGPRFESHHGRSCLSGQSLRYTALGTGCAPLLQCLGRLSLPPSVGR